MKKSESGISLVELMMAILILVIGIISIINMFITSSMNVVTTGNANEAINLCREKLEEIKLHQLDYDSLCATPVRVGTTTIGNCKGTWTITIEGINDSTGQVTSIPSEGDYLRVTVSVIWMERTEHKRRLFTYIGDIRSPE